VGEPAYEDPAIVAFAAANGLLSDVPEPASGSVAVIAGLAFLARWSRRSAQGTSRLQPRTYFGNGVE
jgi:hypothetical protein